MALVAISMVILLFYISGILSHGMLMEPVNRGSAWRKGFKTPPNYDDNGNYCGGFQVQYEYNGGRCGPCGDNYAIDPPRPSENGGLYGTGTIVKSYKVGADFVAIVRITANHLGHFEFALCPLKSPQDIETEECFQQHPVLLADGARTFQVTTSATGDYKIPLRLPPNVVCEHCALRWHYRAGNNWGVCEDGRGRLGCGAQETFRTCSDIRITKA